MMSVEPTSVVDPSDEVRPSPNQLQISLPPEQDDDEFYSDEFDTDLEDTDVTDRRGLGVKRSRDTDIGTDSYRQACHHLKIPPVKIAQDQLWCKHVTLRHVGLGPADTKALAYALSKNCQVERLDLSENSIGHGVGYLINMLADNPNIKEVNLSGNNLTSANSSPLGDLLMADLGVTDLNLANNLLRDVGCQCVAYGLQSNRTLKRLNLSGNEISVGGVQSLAKALSENVTMTSLDLSWNHIRQRAAVLLCRGLQANDGIKSLNVSWNGFGFEGSLALKELFIHNKRIRKLNLINNRINWEGTSFLALGLTENTTLEVLQLGQNPLTMDGCYKLLSAISKNKASNLRFIGFQEIPIDSRVAFKAESIARSRDFTMSHGGIVFTRDVFGTPMKKDSVPQDPVSVLRRYLSQRGIRVIDLFRMLDTRDRQMVSKDNFIRGLKRIHAPLDEEEMEEVSCHFMKTDTFITFRNLADGVKKNLQKQQRHDWREVFLQKKRQEEHRRILATNFAHVVFPAIEYFTKPTYCAFSTPVTGGPSTRASTSVPERKNRSSASFGDSRKTPRAQVEALPPLAKTTPSESELNRGDTKASLLDY